MYFRNEYYFLSNMYPCIIQWQGMVFNSTEAAYQASKCSNLIEAKKFQTLTGLESKKHSKVIKIRKNWQDIKYNVMAQLVFQKFLIHLDLREKLLNTPDYIEETNSWKDVYWGVCDGIGENNLGKILMNTKKYFNSCL